MTDLIISQIELLELQIENCERSGFFTEKEIDRLTFPLNEELKCLTKQLKLYGMSTDQYKEATIAHNAFFAQMPSPALLNTWKTLGMNSPLAKV
jgi:hypothetical protein